MGFKSEEKTKPVLNGPLVATCSQAEHERKKLPQIWSVNPPQAALVWFVINGWGIKAHWVHDQYSSSCQICFYSSRLIGPTQCRRLRFTLCSDEQWSFHFKTPWLSSFRAWQSKKLQCSSNKNAKVALYSNLNTRHRQSKRNWMHWNKSRWCNFFNKAPLNCCSFIWSVYLFIVFYSMAKAQSRQRPCGAASSRTISQTIPAANRTWSPRGDVIRRHLCHEVEPCHLFISRH